MKHFHMVGKSNPYAIPYVKAVVFVKSFFKNPLNHCTIEKKGILKTSENNQIIITRGKAKSIMKFRICPVKNI